MKFLNKFFLYILTALALTFGANASNDVPVEPTTPSGKLKAYTQSGVAIAQEFSHFIYEKTPTMVKPLADTLYIYSAAVINSALIQKMYGNVVSYGTPVVDYVGVKASSLFTSVKPTATQAARQVLSKGKQIFENLENRLPKVEKKED